MVFDLSWYLKWARRDRLRHTDGDVDALLAEFAPEVPQLQGKTRDERVRSLWAALGHN